ncbi:MAG: hypothetical protein K2P78_07190 [Gemmataceae bacterium]|nr:hypothetical protein [Gemmataceae bacterium]
MKAKVWTDAELGAKAARSKPLGLKPTGRWAGWGWTAERGALPGTDHDEVIEARIGRTPGAVRSQRTRRGIPAFRDRRRA